MTPPKKPSQTWASVSEVARHMEVSTATVYRMIDRGELKARRIGRAINVLRSDVARYMSQSEIVPTEPPL